MLKHQSPIPNIGQPPKAENIINIQTIDGDIKNQATDYVEKQFSIIPFINKQQKEQIAHWLAERVQTERLGWSKKLELSIKEIEKQRRVLLLSISRIQTINAQVEHAIQKEAQTEDARFVDDDYDAIQELEQNVMMLCDIAAQMFDDRTQCFKLLGVLPRDMQNHEYVTDLLRQKLTSLDAEIRKLKDESGVNLLSPRSQVSNPSKEGAGTPRQTFPGKKKLPDQRLSNKPVEMVVNLIPFTVTRESNLQKPEKRLGAGKDGKKRRDSDTDAKKKIPKDFVNDSKKKTKSNPELMLGYTEVLKVKPQETGQRQDKTIDSLRNEMKELEMLVSQKDKDLEKYKHHIKTLKHMYHYGNFGLKGAAKIKDLNFMKTNDIAKFSQKDTLSVMSNSLPSIVPDYPVQNGATDNLGLSLDSVLFPPAKTSVSRCLRCRRLYRLQDNHKKACHFHPKAKRKLEQYSDNGKLKTVSFVWDCCHQEDDNEGCCADEHI